MSSIRTGQRIPAFELPDQQGQLISSRALLGKGPVVIYFYPKDDTPGCTREACTFRDQYEDFLGAGAQVVGISADTPESHRQFAAKYRLPFLLLSDQQNTVRSLFGVKGDLFGLIPGRVTFVVDAQGMVQHVFSSQLNTSRHVAEALEVIKRLSADKTHHS